MHGLGGGTADGGRDESGAVIGGTLYPGALSGLDGPAPTCLDTIRHDATTLREGLASR